MPGPRPGTPRAALAHRDFRVLWLGNLGSNIGSWMQNVVLAAYAWRLTHSEVFVASLQFAVLGPQFLLATLGGALADQFDRRRLLLIAQGLQMAASAALTVVVLQDRPARLTLILINVVIGIGQALFLPTYSVATAAAVSKEDLPGAVSLQFVQLNLSRVIGPALGAMVFQFVGAPWVFGANTSSYLICIAAALSVRIAPPRRGPAETPWRRIASGLRYVGAEPWLRWALLTIFLFSFFCLPFVQLMPAIADQNLGIDEKSLSYGLLYATWAGGAALGAVVAGSWLNHKPRVQQVRIGMATFSVALAAFALLRSPAPAFPAAFAVGFTYFIGVTPLSSGFQDRVDDAARGRVMALWFMGFGGTMPWGTMALGYVARQTSISTMLLIGAAAAAWLVVLPLVLAPEPRRAVRSRDEHAVQLAGSVTKSISDSTAPTSAGSRSA